VQIYCFFNIIISFDLTHVYKNLLLFLFLLSERSLEDHELILAIYLTWMTGDDNKFYLRKDFNKYELFRSPNVSNVIMFFAYDIFLFY